MITTILVLGVLAFVGLTIYYAFDLADVSRAMHATEEHRVTLVDVDSADEFATTHHDGAINIPLDVLAKGADRLDRHTPIIVCGRGRIRTQRGASRLRAMGFDDVHSVSHPDF